MPGGKKANKSSRGRSQSPRGKKSTRGGGGGGAAAAEDNPFSALAAEEDITNTDGNSDAEEGKTADEVDHSDDSVNKQVD